MERERERETLTDICTQSEEGELEKPGWLARALHVLSICSTPCLGGGSDFGVGGSEGPSVNLPSSAFSSLSLSLVHHFADFGLLGVLARLARRSLMHCKYSPRSFWRPCHVQGLGMLTQKLPSRPYKRHSIPPRSSFYFYLSCVVSCRRVTERMPSR